MQDCSGGETAETLSRGAVQVELSGVSSTSISLPFITATADGPKHIDATITRSQFEKISSDLLDR